ncbi:MAG TPA: PAS-domain containing protein, partial [Microvirga sp.]|nr:PAS-domain containing protein [Microvirga sp.]
MKIGRGASAGVLTRYGTMLAIFGVLFAVIFASFMALFDQKRLIEKESKINIWFLAQTEIEYLRFLEGFTAFVADPLPVSRDEVGLRLELFWSRLNVLRSGPQSAMLREIDGVQDTVKRLIAALEELEPRIASVNPSDRAGLWRIYGQLQELRQPLRDMVQKGLTHDTDITNADRARQTALFYELLGLFAAVVLGSIVLFVLLYRQTAKAQRLFRQAAESEQAASLARKQLVEAIESITEGFVLFDEHDRIALFNQKYKELHAPIADILEIGVEFDHILREAVRRGGVDVPGGDVEAWVASCLKAHRNPQGAFESQLRDGRWLKISERRTEDGRIVGVHTDITELKCREAELVQKSALLEATLENINQGIAVFDGDLHLLIHNRQFLQMHDLPEDVAKASASYVDILKRISASGEYGAGLADEYIDKHL